jgi:hypothetical protein
VDEVVRWSRDGRGVMFVYQDANYNVVATADYDGGDSYKVIDDFALDGASSLCIDGGNNVSAE